MSTDVNAKLYEKLLLQQAEGRALFHPAVGDSASRGGTVGDCGYIKGGRFWRLFSVFEPPPGLHVRAEDKPDRQFRRTEERPNPNPCFKSSESSSIVVHGGAPFSSFPVDVNARIALDKKEKSFAFLAFSEQHHQSDEWIETRVLQNYLADYEPIIRAYYSRHAIKKGQLLLLCGTTKVIGWCGGVARGTSTSADVQLRVGVAGQPLVDAGVAVTHSTTGTGPDDEVAAQINDAVAQSHGSVTAAQMEAQRCGLTWATTSGPASVSPDTDARFPYCVVVSPAAARWRHQFLLPFWLPVKAAHPGSFSPAISEPGGPTSQQSNIAGNSSLLTASQAPNSSTKATTRMSDLHVEVDADVAAATDDADESDDDDDSDESSDDDGPPDLLSIILDSILDVRPDIELAVGAWTAITGYTTTYGSLPVAEDCVKVIEPANNRHGKAVAHLARIEPVPAHHVQSPQDLIWIPHLETTSSHSMADLTNEISDISPKPIAYGGFSDIYRAKWRNHGNEHDVVLKVKRSGRDAKATEVQQASNKFLGHILASTRPKHRNIVELLGIYLFSELTISLVIPFYDHGSIESYLRRHGRENNEELRYTLMLQVMLGVEYLHAQGIVHTNIRANNVLMADDVTPKLNVPPILWKHVEDYNSIYDDDNAELPYRWMAPEILALEGWDPREKNRTDSDIWSCGCLFIEVESGQQPYHTKGTDQAVILALNNNEPPPRPDNVSDAVWAIASQCFNIDPAKRPSATEVAAQLRRLLSVRVVHGSTPEQEEPSSSTLVAQDVPMEM